MMRLTSATSTIHLCEHGRPNGNSPQHPLDISHVAARSKRARPNVALHFGRRGTPFRQWDFRSARRALDRGRMLELWNSWYETLASVEALAVVIVFVLVAAGVIVLADRRR
jgi:hypothetical protein